MNSADKASVGSERSFKGFGEDADNTSLSSIHKRATFSARLPLQHRNISLDSGASISNNIPEVDDQLQSNENISITNEIAANTIGTKDCNATIITEKLPILTKSALNLMPATSKPSETVTAGTDIVSDSTTFNSKNMSKAAVLRHLFFSQNINNSNNEIGDINHSNLTLSTNASGSNVNVCDTAASTKPTDRSF